MFNEGSIQLDRDTAGRFAELDKLHQISRIVIERFYSLKYEWRQDYGFFFVRYLAVNAGSKDDPDVVRCGPVRDQAANHEVYDLSARRLPRGIWNDDQD